MSPKNSLFDSFISRTRRLRFLLGITALLIFALLIAVVLDGEIEEFTNSFSWRGLLIPTMIIIYILAVAPGMHRMEERVLNSLQVIFLLDDLSYEETINQLAKIEPRREFFSIGIGLFLGVFAALGSMGGELTWVNAYWLITTIAMYALLIWTIYISIASTRLISALLKQPLNVDPFNTKSFEPIGRQSLMIALVFIGGITISLVFIGVDYSSFRQPIFWLVYVPLGLVPIILFFLNMLPTHRVLANTKDAELAEVRTQLHNTCRVLLNKMEHGQETDNIPNEINALAVYEKQLKETRTWPYNTTMLRTLFFSVLIPIGTLVGRIIIEALSN